MVLVGFFKILSHDPESMLSHVVALSEVLDKGHLDLAYHPTFEVTPKTLELAQTHTAVEEAVPTSQHRIPQCLCISEVLPWHLEPTREYPATEREVLSKAYFYGVSKLLW
jgi:hypothetical protein